MTAVILAGGNGTGMKPLTCSKAKAMLEICNIPLIEYIVNNLERCGITSHIIAADRFSKAFADYFDDGRESIPCFSFSPTPAGTAKALKKAATEWNITENEPVAVVSGNGLGSFDYREILSFHKQNGCEVTVIAKKSERPCEGTAAIAENGILKGIAVNQPKESCVSGLVLTGTMILNGGICLSITDYGSDISADVLANLIESGVKIGVYEETGYFEFLRDTDDLLKLNYDMLNGLYPYPLFKQSRENYGNAEITPPVCIGRNVEIADDVKIGSGTVIGDNVTIGRGAKINGSLIGRGSFVGSGCTVNSGIIGEGAHLSAEASVYEKAVVGEGAAVGECTVICPSVKIWNGRRTEAFSQVRTNLKYGSARNIEIDEEGITGETNNVITPQLAAAIGSAAASLGSRIIFGCRNSSAANALAMAFSSGVMSSGSEAWFLGEVTEPELTHCIRLCGGSAGCYIEAGINAKFRFFSRDGLPASAAEERIIESALNKNGYRRSSYSRFGNMRYCPEIKTLYFDSLIDEMPAHLNGIKAVINAPSKRITEMCGTLLNNINDKNGTPVVFHISSDGTKLSAYTEKTGYVFADKLTLICCKNEFEKGRDVALPCDFPSAADMLGEKYGCKVLRYPCGDKNTRKLAAENSFVRDGVRLMLKTLKVLTERNITLEKACNELPEFGTVNRFAAIDAPRWRSAEILRKMAENGGVTDNGVIIKDKNGRIMIRPVKAGRGIMMYAESYAMEAASEMCDFYCEEIKKQAKEIKK